MSKKITSANQSSVKHLPVFPDEETPIRWICPPYLGSKILNQVVKHALRPRLRPDGTWIINAKNQWRCFSKSHWLYTNTKLAQAALRVNMRIHLQCCPILSKQRCVIVAPDSDNNWRLWQIAQLEPTLAKNLKDALAANHPDELAIETFKCSTRYADALQQCIRYPLLLNITLENLGTDTNQLMYFGSIEDNETTNTIQPITESAVENAIRHAFTNPIAKALPNCDITEIVNALEAIDGFEQQYILEILKNLFLKNKPKII